MSEKLQYSLIILAQFKSPITQPCVISFAAGGCMTASSRISYKSSNTLAVAGFDAEIGARTEEIGLFCTFVFGFRTNRCGAGIWQGCWLGLFSAYGFARESSPVLVLHCLVFFSLEYNLQSSMIGSSEARSWTWPSCVLWPVVVIPFEYCSEAEVYTY